MGNIRCVGATVFHFPAFEQEEEDNTGPPKSKKKGLTIDKQLIGPS